MIIVTGSRGFIGKRFIARLGSHAVFEVDQHNMNEFMHSFDRWEEVTLVLHQGAVSSTTSKDLDEILSRNIQFTKWLLEKCSQYAVAVKYASSASVYGTPWDGAIKPKSLYALSKQIIDSWVEANLSQFALIQGFRYFNVYGLGEEHKVIQKQASPIATFAHQAATQQSISLFQGSESFFRDFIWVEDLVTVVLENNEGSGVFDLGTGATKSFRDVAILASEKWEVPVKTVPMPAAIALNYQTYTCSSKDWQHEFKTVGGFIETCDLDEWGF